MEYAEALGRQLEAVKAERAAAEEAGRRQHATLVTKEEALSAAQQKTLVRKGRVLQHTVIAGADSRREPHREVGATQHTGLDIGTMTGSGCQICSKHGLDGVGRFCTGGKLGMGGGN